ncbi:hypothetical protein KCV01_g9926, partial [Aureobasidium melanogenum]
MTLTALMAFWAVAILLILTPGADWAYAIAAGIRGRGIMLSVTGLILGHLTMMTVVAIGAGALLTAHPATMAAITYAGAFYLMVIGARIARHPPVPAVDDGATETTGGRWLVGGWGYTKEPLSFSDQLRLLQQRGLRIADPSQAMLYLERVGYYRLMGYLFPFRLPHSDHYGPDAAFEHAIAHYQFDQGLRILVMEAIEHIEIAVRAAATYRISHTYGAFGHRNPRNISWAKAWHDEWLAKIDGEVCRSRETFVLHYADTYSSPAYPQVPLWMASEVMSLGAVSKWVASMHHGDRKAIAARFDLPAPVFENWLHVVSVVRNITSPSRQTLES